MPAKKGFFFVLGTIVRGLLVMALNGVFTLALGAMISGLSIFSFFENDSIFAFMRVLVGLIVFIIGLLQAIACRLVHISHDSGQNTAIIKGIKLPVMVVSSPEQSEQPESEPA